FPSLFVVKLFIMWFAVDLGWFETGGLNSSSLPSGASGFEVFGDMIWHLILPILVMVILDVGSLMRYTRTNTLEVLNADYIRTARAKGLSEGKVVYKHVFRNTLIPLITVLASTLPMLFGGAMITETVFDIPGIGNATYTALMEGDIPLAMGYNMFIAVLTVIGTLLADIMYAVVDPRVKLR
ncbi:MAG: ABC transporter permease, partial [Clostridia bacterium]|nr:ABC transporter permease [Clostridia bacterium]